MSGPLDASRVDRIRPVGAAWDPRHQHAKLRRRHAARAALVIARLRDEAVRICDDKHAQR
jgi:hypothetical protein